MGYLFLDPVFLWRVVGVHIVGLFIEDGVDQSGPIISWLRLRGDGFIGFHVCPLQA